MLAVFLVPAYVILHMLRRLVRTVAEGEPFQAKNVARIRIIGLVIVARAEVFRYGGNLQVESDLTV